VDNYTYFNGAFSNDTTLKADFLSINESFTESMPFNNGPNMASAVQTSSYLGRLGKCNQFCRGPEFSVSLSGFRWALV